MQTPLRIALVVDPLTMRTKGGAHAPQLAAELLGRGHIVRGFGAPPGVIPHSGAEDEALAEEVGSEDGGAGAGGEGGGEDGALPKVGADPVGLARFAADVIVAYDALSPAAWLGARTARKQNSALVLVEGGIARSDIRLHERFLQSVGERLWGRFVRDSCISVVALDTVARDKARAEGFEEAVITLLPEGIDTARFRPDLTSGLISSRRIRGRVLLYAGPLEIVRGTEVLLQAFARTVGQREDWNLVLAGDGSARQRLRVLSDRLGVGARVQLLPRVRSEELPGLMGASTLLAVPALDNATRGRQVARAMACGLPVLASDVERLRYFVEPDQTGILVTPGDVIAWTEAIRRAAGSPEARRRWGRRGREIAEERFAWRAVGAAFEGILRQAVERRGAA